VKRPPPPKKRVHKKKLTILQEWEKRRGAKKQLYYIDQSPRKGKHPTFFVARKEKRGRNGPTIVN